MVPDFKAAAAERGVPVDDVKTFYGESVESLRNDLFLSQYLSVDDVDVVATNLNFALAMAVNRHNGVVAYKYARAFMEDDKERLSTIKLSINNLPADRQADIQASTEINIRTFCVSTHLPAIKIDFAADNTITHKMSGEDAAFFHAIFTERQKLVDAVVAQNKSTSDLSQQLANVIEFTERVGHQWNLENRHHDFPSVTDHVERSTYDGQRQTAQAMEMRRVNFNDRSPA